MILNAPEDDFSKVEIAQVINFEDSGIQVKQKSAADRPKSAKRPGTAKKKKPLEKIVDENEQKKQKIAEQTQPAAVNPAQMFPKAKGLKDNY